MDWISNLCNGVSMAGAVYQRELNAYAMGFDQGELLGKKKGAMVVIGAAKKRFGSRNQELLINHLSAHHQGDFGE